MVSLNGRASSHARELCSRRGWSIKHQQAGNSTNRSKETLPPRTSGSPSPSLPRSSACSRPRAVWTTCRPRTFCRYPGNGRLYPRILPRHPCQLTRKSAKSSSCQRAKTTLRYVKLDRSPNSARRISSRLPRERASVIDPAPPAQGVATRPSTSSSRGSAAAGLSLACPLRHARCVSYVYAPHQHTLPGSGARTNPEASAVFSRGFPACYIAHFAASPTVRMAEKLGAEAGTCGGLKIVGGRLMSFNGAHANARGLSAPFLRFKSIAAALFLKSLGAGPRPPPPRRES